MGAILGLITAGVAVALQRVITALAGYLIIRRGKIFVEGDRIAMGGVRGDVVALGYMQTSVMEMGQSGPEQSAEPAMWIGGRQYTGRIVRVTNDKVFDMPVYNYTREFPFIWEEIHIPVKFDADHAAAEKILLDAASRHTKEIVDRSTPAAANLRARYPMKGEIDLEPQVYWRLTDSWLELSLRFVSGTHGTRKLKDAMSREILEKMREADIEIASTTFEVVGIPPVKVAS